MIHAISDRNLEHMLESTDPNIRAWAEGEQRRRRVMVNRARNAASTPRQRLIELGLLVPAGGQQ